MSSRLQRTCIFFLAFAFSFVPLAVYLWRYRMIAAVDLFAGDAFYYLDIARNSLGRTGFTFDGVHVTNGFHPLWQWTLIGLGHIGFLHFNDLAGTLVRVAAVNIVLLGLAAAVFCIVCTRYLQPPQLALLTVAPGLLWWFVACITPIYLSTWSYANGMESALSWLCFSLALLAFDDTLKHLPRLTLVGLFLGLAVLARLDDVFIVAAIAVWIVLKATPAQRLRTAAAMLPIAILLGAYLGYNRLSVGVFLPLSGAAKAGFVLWGSVKWTLRLFIPIFTGDPPNALRAATNAPVIFIESTIRQLQMVLPAAICLGELLYLAANRRKATHPWTIFHAAAVGVILKAAYNFCFVQAFDQGMWYYTVPIAAANFFLVLWLGRCTVRLWASSPGSEATHWKFLAFHLLTTLFAMNAYFNARNLNSPIGCIRALQNPQAVQARLRSLGATQYIEIDDGFSGYVGQGSPVGGLGLVLDREAALAIRQGRFLDLMYHRGYRVLVAESGYVNLTMAAVQASAKGLHPSLLMLQAAELDKYQLSPVSGDGLNDGIEYFLIAPRTP